jgi:hypothetical protein
MEVRKGEYPAWRSFVYAHGKRSLRAAGQLAETGSGTIRRIGLLSRIMMALMLKRQLRGEVERTLALADELAAGR